jgi:hypothetical protein
VRFQVRCVAAVLCCAVLCCASALALSAHFLLSVFFVSRHSLIARCVGVFGVFFVR